MFARRQRNSGIVRLGGLVRVPGCGGAAVPDAIDFEAVRAGARESGLDDDRLLDEGCRRMDAVRRGASTVELETSSRSSRNVLLLLLLLN